MRAWKRPVPVRPARLCRGGACVAQEARSSPADCQRAKDIKALITKSGEEVAGGCQPRQADRVGAVLDRRAGGGDQRSHPFDRQRHPPAVCRPERDQRVGGPHGGKHPAKRPCGRPDQCRHARPHAGCTQSGRPGVAVHHRCKYRRPRSAEPGPLERPSLRSFTGGQSAAPAPAARPPRIAPVSQTARPVSSPAKALLGKLASGLQSMTSAPASSSQKKDSWEEF